MWKPLRNLASGSKVMSPRPWYPAKIGAVAAVYFGAAKLGLLAAVAQKVVSSAWPPTGVALATLLLFGVRFWPGIALGAFLLNWTSGVPAAGAAGIAAGNTLEAVTAVLLLRRVAAPARSEEHTSELQLLTNLVCRLLLEKKKPVVGVLFCTCCLFMLYHSTANAATQRPAGAAVVAPLLLWELPVSTVGRRAHHDQGNTNEH